MRLIELMEICDENKELVVYEYQNGELLAKYDGRNSIPKSFNDCEVAEFRGDENGVSIWINVKVQTLAERVDRIIHDFNIYDYVDMEGSVEQAEYCIKTQPEAVIEELVGIIESLNEE